MRWDDARESVLFWQKDSWLMTAALHEAEKRIAELEEENHRYKNQIQELENAVKVAYRKHHMNDDSIGWEELSDILFYALCNVLGDDGYQKWKDSLEVSDETLHNGCQ